MAEERLLKQIDFLMEIDRLKTVFRRAYITDTSRRENSAEHSWHVATTAMVLAEHCQEEIGLLQVVKMLLVHDIVEIDAGDTGIYDSIGTVDKAEREGRAAERLFSLLPVEQAQELRGLWDEFEEGTTPEAQFARALDRLMPLLHNYYTQGKRWLEDGITYEQVLAVNQSIREGSEQLWDFALSMVEESVLRGYLPRASKTRGDS
ncbi:MAG: HD domain-containing protein [Dehalococcoidales bacterium]|nr:MAG: HD domain-containing protein [Dehalococcoidales bacterium]